MSVEYSAYIVDWEVTQAKIQDMEAMEYFCPDEDEEDGESEPEYLEPNLSGSARVSMVFLEAYTHFSPHWTSPSKAGMEQFFRTLFWSCTGTSFRIMDLEVPEEHTYGVDFAFSPTTVTRLAELAEVIDLESLKTAFRPSANTSDYFPNADEFAASASEWIDLLLKARSRSAGIIALVFG